VNDPDTPLAEDLRELAEGDVARVGVRPPVQVQIFGHRYTIRGEADQRYILDVAAYVDAKMKEITEKLPVASISKVAVLASLNIADELFKERAARERDEQQLRLRAQQLVSELDRALERGDAE
jgi:cell division protein ZapA